MSAPDRRHLKDEATAVPRLAEQPLERILKNNGNALSNVMARVVREAAQGAQNYAAHSSSPAPSNSDTAKHPGVGKS